MATKQFTVSHFKEIVRPALSQRPIYVRKDVTEDPGGTAKDVATKVAQLLPLVRVNDFVIERANITYFSLEVGKTFLPKITFTFDDEAFRCRKLLTSKLDFITVYFGNVSDEYYVKQEYVLSDVYANPGNPNVTLTGFLYVPKFYDQHIRYFNEENDAETSWKLIKKMCEECQLGMFTNIDETNDAQTWIQDNCTNYDFLQNVMRHSYVGNDTKLIYFIDQYDYLNVIDLTKAYSNREKERTSKHPMQGTPLLEEKEVILSSSRYEDVEKDQNPFAIKSWTANIKYGSNIERLPHRVQRNEYGLSALPFEVVTGELGTNTEIIDHTWYVEPIVSDVHPNYRNIHTERGYVDKHFDQGDEISCEMSWPIMLLYPYMYTPIKLYYEQMKVEYDDQNKETPSDQLDQEKPMPSKEPEIFDELHSGDYLITSIHYEVVADGEDTNLQTVTLKRLPLENPPKIKTT